MDGYTYTGAPDECSIHWPAKLVNGYCPNEECPNSRERSESFMFVNIMRCAVRYADFDVTGGGWDSIRMANPGGYTTQFWLPIFLSPRAVV